MKYSLKAQIWKQAAVAVFVITGLCGLTSYSYFQVAEAHRWVSHTQKVLHTSDELLTALVEAETGQRGFLLTNHSLYLKPYTKAMQTTPARLAELAELTADDTLQVSRLSRTQQLVSERLSILAQSIALMNQGKREAALAMVVDGQGRMLMENIRSKLDEFAEVERQKLIERQELAQSTQAQLLWIMAISGGIGILAIILFAKGMVLGIERSLRALLDGTKAIASGNMDYRLPNLHKGEFGSVAQAFNYMAEAREKAERVRAHTQEELRNINQTLLERTETLQQRNDCVELLGKMAHRLQIACSDAEFVEVVGRFVPLIIPGVAGGLYLVNNSRNLLEVMISWGNPISLPSHFSPQDCWGLRLGQSHCVENMCKDVCCAHIQGVNAFTCRPLSAQGDVIGLIYMEAAVPDGAGDPLSILCENVSLALVNNRLRTSLREQSIRDGLTGLFNRRYMDEALALELARATRSNQPLSIILFDVDHFKKLNDTHGHDAGDAVLKAVGSMVGDMFRDGDITCRYGGEEFLVILTGVSAQNAKDRANIMRQRIKSLAVDHGKNTLPQITISAGIASFPAMGTTPDQLIKAADSALYKAKHNGRDQVLVAQALAAGELVVEGQDA